MTTTGSADDGGGSTLRSFLADLATDPVKLGEYIGKPDDAMTRAGLGDEEKELLKSGNLAQIYARLMPERPTPTMVVVVKAEELQRSYQALAGALAGAPSWGPMGYPPPPWMAFPWMSPAWAGMPLQGTAWPVPPVWQNLAPTIVLPPTRTLVPMVTTVRAPGWWW